MQFFLLLSVFFVQALTISCQNATESLDETVVIPTLKPTKFLDKVRAIGRKQAVGVRGKLLCGGVAVKNATVKLWDNDMFDPDDLIAESHVKPDGTFEVFGLAISITKIDPQLRIYHNCRSESKECRRKITFTIPDNYINKGPKVTKWFDLGTPNMEFGVRHKEEPHCF
ncbi:unnamed protein product [Caenorhabditis sp. 36 PRJEB53466]|nr:unnamed protein product [Caenorhabditis sp. 36 PRJEB53466]